ncbi:MAG: hypothetical protein ABEN55_03905 [Bradymonadaceae bacterium]
MKKYEIMGRSDDRVTIIQGEESKYFTIPMEGSGLVELVSGSKGARVVFSYQRTSAVWQIDSLDVMDMPDSWSLTVSSRDISPVVHIEVPDEEDVSLHTFVRSFD